MEHRSIASWPVAAGLLCGFFSIQVFSAPVSRSSGTARTFSGDLNQQERGEQSSPLDNTKAKPEFTLPPLAPPPTEHALSSQLRVFCREIRLSGNTVFSPAEIKNVTAPYENRLVTTDELQQLRYLLSKLYIDHGYVNSGAVIPDQEPKDGVIHIKLVEGRLEHIEIEGAKHLNEAYLTDRIQLSSGPPLEMGRLQERLQLLLESPLIERLNADLRPGSAPGLAVLKANLAERSPYQLGVSFDNQIAPSIGGYQGVVYAGHRSLTGHGDTFTAQSRFAEGMTSFGFDYWLPLNRYDTTVHAWYSHYDSELIKSRFNEIDVTSRSDSYGINLSHPVYRTPERSLTASLSVERRSSKTFLEGEPFPFSPGVQSNGESSVTVIRLGQEWMQRTTQQALSLRSTFNFGVDALDATINRNKPDGRFFSWLGQMQYALRVSEGQLIWRTDLQVSKVQLLPLEKFQIGGATSVRGYRENEIVRDWGFSSSLEYRYPLFADFFGQNKFFVAPFSDLGGAWNVDAKPVVRPEFLISVGLGVIWEPDAKVHTHLYWGKPLIDVSNPQEDPQDYGFHFKLAGQFF